VISLQLEKLQAAGYKPVLLLGKATKKSHVVKVFTPRCTLATFAEESLKKMGSIHEYICQGMILYFYKFHTPSALFTKILTASCYLSTTFIFIMELLLQFFWLPFAI
jgi:hypothetical protein